MTTYGVFPGCAGGVVTEINFACIIIFCPLLFFFGIIITQKIPTRVGKRINFHCHMARHGGTPPRMWGKGSVMIEITFGSGNTPTHVGKRDRDTITLPLPRDHPPLAWGKACRNRPRCIHRRNTPTRVGKSCHIERGQLDQAGPPPLAWGKLSVLMMIWSESGPPPLAWGKGSYFMRFSECFSKFVINFFTRVAHQHDAVFAHSDSP